MQIDVHRLIWHVWLLAVTHLCARRQIVFYFVSTIPPNSEAIIDVSQDWKRLPTQVDGATPCITGGSCMVRVWRNEHEVNYRRLLPVELLALQGARFFAHTNRLLESIA